MVARVAAATALVCTLSLAPASAAEWSEAPIILRASDVVVPGDVFFVYGEGLTGDDLRILVGGLDGAESPARIVGRDPDGHFLAAVLPAQVPGGEMRVRVRTQFGISKPFQLNAPRELWLAHDTAWPGQTVRMAGFNISARRIGSRHGTRVRILRSDQRQSPLEVPVDRVDDYEIEFRAPDVPAARYRIELSTDGGKIWVACLDDLQLVRAATDPLGLGVGWAREFSWNRVVPVEAAISPDVDDTDRIQRALDRAAASGGGVVRLSPGVFRVTHLGIDAGVVLTGAGPSRTTLSYVGAGESMITATGKAASAGRFGIARLALTAASLARLPDVFVALGQPWGAAVEDLRLRTARNVFCVDVDIRYDLAAPTRLGHRGIGILAVGDRDCVIARCHFIGYRAVVDRAYFNRYFDCADNTFEYANGVLMTSASRAFIVRNRLTGHREYITDPKLNDEDLHGIFGRDHLFAAYNVVTGMGAHEGEAICVEFPGGLLSSGRVISAGRDSVETAELLPVIDIGKRQYSAWSIAIISGRGLGQVRRIESMTGRTIAIVDPWAVTPDDTSRYTILLPNDDVIIYRNTAKDCVKGFWLWGNVFDATIDHNTSTDSEGVLVNGHREHNGAMAVSYFVRIANNRVDGVSPRSHHAGVGVRSDRAEFRESYGISVFGVEILGNDIRGRLDEVPQRGTEAPPLNGVFVVSDPHESTTPEACDRVAILVANNKVRAVETGISTGRDTCGIVSGGNEFFDVARHVRSGARREYLVP